MVPYRVRFRVPFRFAEKASYYCVDEGAIRIKIYVPACFYKTRTSSQPAHHARGTRTEVACALLTTNTEREREREGDLYLQQLLLLHLGLWAL